MGRNHRIEGTTLGNPGEEEAEQRSWWGLVEVKVRELGDLYNVSSRTPGFKRKEVPLGTMAPTSPESKLKSWVGKATRP